ncbi:MAG: class I adenylate-forming enzyme family protein [Acidimicrobiales bacterium]
MTLTYEEAVAQVTAPGQIFETTDIEVGGVIYKAFKHAPASLRDLWGMSRAHGDKTFLVYEDERWSFTDVMQRVDGFAAALVDRYGVAPGDGVAIAMRNFPEWVVAFAAITSVGAISVSMNAWWTEDEIAFALSDSGASIMVADGERVARSAGACDRLGVRVVVVRSEGELPPFAETWEDVVVVGAPLPEVTVGPDDDATILYTSGTTGRPKGAVSTHRAILQALMGFAARAMVDAARRPEGPTELTAAAAEESFILVVPLFHVTGCVPVMMSCFAFGMKLVIMHRWDPERALELIERERVTTFVGVPTQSWDLVECPTFANYDTSSLKAIGGGGAPAPPALVRKVASSFEGGEPGIGYGMTETNAYGPGNTGDDYLTHPTSTGRATPILEIEIRDPAGRPVPTGESGEIWLKGPSLIRGYWGRPEETAATMVDGWLRTGDAGHLDEEGFLYIEDRLKDMILRGGENVYCAEVEAALYEHPGVNEAAVLGVPHPRLGEEVAAVVSLKPGREVSEGELQAHVAERLAAFKVPSRIRLLE